MLDREKRVTQISLNVMPLQHDCKGILRVAREKIQHIHMGQKIHIFPDLYSSHCVMLHAAICHGCLSTYPQGRNCLSQLWVPLKYSTSTVWNKLKDCEYIHSLCLNNNMFVDLHKLLTDIAMRVWYLILG